MLQKGKSTPQLEQWLDRLAPVVERMAEGAVIEPGAGTYDDFWELIEGYDEDLPEEPGDGE